jgi:Tfp pilus assembly PilM family ATPase
MNEPKAQPHELEEKPIAEEQPIGSRAGAIKSTRVWHRAGPCWGRVLAFFLDETSIQMAAVTCRAGRIRVRHVEKVYLPRTQAPETALSALTGPIDSWVRKYGGRRPRITLAVGGERTAYRVFFMPVLKARDLNSAISYELGHQIPFPVHDCYCDYRPIFKVGDKGQQRYRIALAAATRRFVSEQLAPFRALNLDVSHVYLAQEVVGQLLKRLPNYNEEQHYTLVHIKRNSSEIAFYRGCSLEFFNTVSTGSSMLDGEGGTTRFEYFAESLATEIQTSLDYYTGQYSRNYTSDIYVYGDLSYGDGLVSLLNGRTSFTFQNFPADRLGLAMSYQGAFEDVLPVCLPALAAATCRERMAGLLPDEERNRLARGKLAVAGRATLLSLALLAATNWYVGKLGNDGDAARLAQLQTQVESFRNSDAYGAYSILKRQVAADRQYVETARKQPSHFHLALKELSLMTPPSIDLSNLSYTRDADGKTLTIIGVASGCDIPPEVTLAEYAVTLASSPFFGEVAVIKHVKRSADDKCEIDFAIKMREVI